MKEIISAHTVALMDLSHRCREAWENPAAHDVQLLLNECSVVLEKQADVCAALFRLNGMLTGARAAEV